MFKYSFPALINNLVLEGMDGCSINILALTKLRQWAAVMIIRSEIMVPPQKCFHSFWSLMYPKLTIQGHYKSKCHNNFRAKIVTKVTFAKMDSLPISSTVMRICLESRFMQLVQYPQSWVATNEISKVEQKIIALATIIFPTTYQWRMNEFPVLLSSKNDSLTSKNKL